MSAVVNSPANSFVMALPHAPPRVVPRLDHYNLTGWATLAVGLVAVVVGTLENSDASLAVRAMTVLVPAYMLTVLPLIAYWLVRADPR